MVNAQELKARRQRLGLEAEIAARDAQRNVVNDLHRPLAPWGRVHQQAHMVFEEDDLDLDGVGATGAIVLPILPLSVKFTITSIMIQLLNLKGMFRGVVGDDANKYLMNIVAICKSHEILGVSQTAMRQRLFLVISDWGGDKLAE
ncbi:hypothetical protein KY285_005015 [Solanum tuberosum]|nr:hypothetical protein KY289_005532 [Solanum tuberosum]KAH0751867.1 hypothetical protein KY285_005015 [Solanum tuberosum]